MESYKQYLEELHDGKSLIYNEKGFASYWIRESEFGKECYIEDVYVKKEFRRSNVSKEFILEITEKAKDNKCNHLTANTVPSANDSTLSLKAMIGNGFKLWCSSDNIIWFKKDL